MALHALGLVLVCACSTESTDEADTDSPRLLSSAAAGDTALLIGAGDIGSCHFNSKDEATAAPYPVARVHAPTSETSVAQGYFYYFNGPGIDSGVAGKRGAGYYAYDHGAWCIYALNSERNNRRTFTGAATYTYKVCEPGTAICSNDATAVFR